MPDHVVGFPLDPIEEVEILGFNESRGYIVDDREEDGDPEIAPLGPFILLKCRVKIFLSAEAELFEIVESGIPLIDGAVNRGKAVLPGDENSGHDQNEEDIV